MFSFQQGFSIPLDSDMWSRHSIVPNRVMCSMPSLSPLDLFFNLFQTRSEEAGGFKPCRIYDQQEELQHLGCTLTYTDLPSSLLRALF